MSSPLNEQSHGWTLMSFKRVLCLTAAILFLAQATAALEFTQEPVPDSDFFRGWVENQSQTVTAKDLNSFTEKKTNCPNQRLFPTHPQQTTKTYHHSSVGRYSTRRSDGTFMPATAQACEVGQKKNFGRAYPICLATRALKFDVLSDFYMDSCGGYYRGFWSLTYFASDDNMGTLSSLGRTMQEPEHSDFPGMLFLPSRTYSLSASDFIFLSPVTPDEIVEIRRLQEAAQKAGLIFNRESLLFE